MRIKHRKYGREVQNGFSSGATHVIKIGFDRRRIGAKNPKHGDKYPIPGKLPGFILCRDTVDKTGFPVIDFEAMKRLGVMPEQIEQAMRADDTAQGLLPTTLNFLIMADAEITADGTWFYPGVFSEEYACWDKNGLFCIGNGDHAMRKQNDGTKKKIICNPVGKDGVPAHDLCQESCSKLCKAHTRVIVCLYYDGPDGKPVPVVDWEARFRFDTTSEYCPIRISEVLDKAARKLGGRIALLRGTLSFAVQPKRTGEGKANVQQVHFALSQHDIAMREQKLWGMRIEEGRVAKGLLTTDAPAPSDDDLLQARADEMSAEQAPFMGDDEPIEATYEEQNGRAPMFDDRNAPEQTGAREVYEDAPAAALARVSAAEATHDEMVAALQMYAADCARETGEAFPATLMRITTVTLSKDGKTGTFKTDAINVFKPGGAYCNERGTMIIRAICEQIEQKNDPRFEILREVAAHAGS
jgi:hypothetical protein